MHKYHLEFTLHAGDTHLKTLKDSLAQLGEDLEITPVEQDSLPKQKDFKIQMYTEDPTLVFDACGQFGRIKSVKVSED